MTQRVNINAFVRVLIFILIAGSVYTSETEPHEVVLSDKGEETKSRPWIAAPLVIANPGFGNGAGAVGLYFFRPDPSDQISPASTVGLVGLYSDTDSYIAGLFAQAFLKEDTWRVAGGGITGKINNEFDIDGFQQTVEFSTLVNAVFARVDRRVTGNYFLGCMAGVVGINYREGNEASKLYFDLFGVEDNLSGQFAAIGFHDSRDDVRYPTTGNYSEINLTFVPEWLGSVEGYHVLEVSANQFFTTFERQVLALRGYGRFTPSGTPYSGLSSLGKQSDLRGYTTGENLAENLIAVQAEYRLFLTRRLGAVGFAGMSELYDGSIKNINSDTFYPSAGLGLRFMLHEENKINFRFDYAWGSRDERGFYVGVGEAF